MIRCCPPCSPGFLLVRALALFCEWELLPAAWIFPRWCLISVPAFLFSVFLYAFDTVILLSQAFFSDLEKILYSILVTLLTSLIINKVMLIGKSQVQVMIISEKYQEINNVIQTSLDRGSTFLQSITGHLQKEQLIVLSILSPRELPNLNRLISQIDPMAFMTVTQVNEVKGRGFTLKKHG